MPHKDTPTPKLCHSSSAQSACLRRGSWLAHFRNGLNVSNSDRFGTISRLHLALGAKTPWYKIWLTPMYKGGSISWAAASFSCDVHRTKMPKSVDAGQGAGGCHIRSHTVTVRPGSDIYIFSVTHKGVSPCPCLEHLHS
jgi:hypothetical protein